MSIAFDVLLVVLVLAAAGFVLFAPEPRAAVIGFLALGLLLALVWVRLGAVDVALTEVAIGGAATGLLLLRAAARLGHAPVPYPRPVLLAVAAAFCAAVSVALGLIVLGWPAEGPSLAAVADANLDAFGIRNPVTAVLLGYRALDTLLEKIVLLLAIAGVWAMARDDARDDAWGEAPAPLADGRRDAQLELLARALPPIGILFGIYLVWAGADHPGGTFQGGAVLAGMWLLAMMAGVVHPPRTDARWLRLALFGGPALFIVVGLAGIPAAGAFLAYPPALAKPIIVAVEAVLTLAIAVVVALLVAGPPERARP